MCLIGDSIPIVNRLALLTMRCQLWNVRITVSGLKGHNVVFWRHYVWCCFRYFCYRCNRGTVIWYSNISLWNKVKLQTIYNIFIKLNIFYNEFKTTQHGFNIFINNCLFNMHIFNIQHKEYVQISHDLYIRKPRLSGNFLGNEGVRINKVSL